MQYGVLCLLPPAAMLIFALKTKKSFEALIFGTLVAYLIMYKAAFIGPWCDLLLSEISNADNQYILLLCGLFGGFIFLLREAKGTLGFSNLLSRFCKNERITMMMSVFLGIIIFVDDYLNIMTVGTCMKDVCDKRKVPRQALAYIIDSTGAPVCALIPFSTWVVFYSGVFIQEPGILNMGFSTGASLYVLSHGCTSGCHSVCLQTDAKARKNERCLYRSGKGRADTGASQNAQCPFRRPCHGRNER